MSSSKDLDDLKEEACSHSACATDYALRLAYILWGQDLLSCWGRQVEDYVSVICALAWES